MRPPRSPRARRLGRLASMTAQLVRMLDLLAVLDIIKEMEPAVGCQRSTLMPRERRSWEEYVKPMLGDDTFKLRFRMEHDDFMMLVEMLRKDLQRDVRMGGLRNGAVPVEYQVALTLRWLAGGSIYEGMDGHVIARSTAYQTAHRVISAINRCSQLNCKWPEGEDAVRAAGLFKNRSSFGVIRKCVGAMDGLFVRIIRPTLTDAPEPNSYFSGHKKGFGMNFQAICDADYRIIMWTMNCPGSQNDRTAFKFSGFENILGGLPPDYFIVGDAAYPASDRVLVPFPGTALTTSQDAFNFYLSQCRMAIEQTFGMMVRRWGILWRPLEVRLTRAEAVINSIVRLHNFCRERMTEVPKNDAPGVTPPAGVSFSNNDTLIDKGFFETVSVRTGRRLKDQMAVSKPREYIRRELEILGMVRPAHNIARNSAR